VPFIAPIVALSLAAMGCTGILDGSLPSAQQNPGNAGGMSSGGTSGATNGGDAPVAPAGYKAIHRLNRNEYNATVADVLGTSLQPANGSWFDGEVAGFDNIATVQIVDEDQYQRYFDTAGILADDAFANAAFKTKFVSCATSDATCVGNVIGTLGLHLFRRPLLASEIANYATVYAAAQAQQETHEGALKHVLRALLSSSEFLYRMEFDPDPNSSQPHALSAYELASRVSYFLWSSAPDDALLSAAKDESLLKQQTLQDTVDRLLLDAQKAPRFVQNFYGQWLGARRLASHAVAPDVYPQWTPELASSLTQEMYSYFADFLYSDRSWLEFLTADVNFVNAPIASLYGQPAPSAPGLQKTLITSDQRRGFLGLGGFLALSSMDRRTSPTLRGRWVLLNLLCTKPPPPPDNVPKIEAAAGGTDLSKGNVRAVLEKHRADPNCARCHQLFDPYGLPLEQFDGIGQYRDKYVDGSPVDPSTQLLDGTPVKGLTELTDALSKNPLFEQCIADNMYTYGLGRVLTSNNRTSLDAIQKAWNAQNSVPSIRRLIHSIVLDDSFRSRSGQAAP
jgi:Protein of unknown function (DUF1592)/Protein of unknown function (DUF1588)/Protein of unknown function (DUF1587)/Protein of unknown function (DUF1595)/Protein of unknown function (DUF1585)